MKLYLIATQMIYYVTFMFWIVFWGMALTAVLQVSSLQHILFFALTTIYPIAVIVCTIIAWYYHQTNKGLSVSINLIPAIWLIGYYIYFFN
ncbi:MAG TPA: hypothetical protein VNR38_10480 [Ureibacillus sp.]|nr:hypothetical protein [Ureibacillus sp.]